MGNHTNTLYIRAKNGSLESNQISIEDLYDYDPMTSDSGKWNWVSGITPNFSENGCRITGTVNNTKAGYNGQLPSDYEVEATFRFESNAQDLFDFGDFSSYHGTYQNIQRLILYTTWPPNYYVNHNPWATNTDITIVFRAENNVVSIIYNDITLLSGNVNTIIPLALQYYSSTRIRTIKDVKIRQL